MRFLLTLMMFVAFAALVPAQTLQRPGVTYKVFQFPADKIPRVDGDASDWSIVPEDHVISSDQMAETVNRSKRDPKNLDVRVKVGWVKGMNRLYFLYEAYDNYWDFSLTDLHNDIFEVVVDGDLSGGPLIAPMHPNKAVSLWDAYFSFQGVHAQNYHIFTPALGKDWTMVWGCQTWIKDLPYANAAYNYSFKPGESGKLTLEFWITPFDYAGCEGPRDAVESKLMENKTIGLSWAVLDYDDVNAKTYAGFWNLSHKTTMYGNASDLVAFRLMPLDGRFRKGIEADWTFRLVDPNRRLVAFTDASQGEVTAWKWDFGDKTESADRHPVHAYREPGHYVVTLYVEGPAGKSRRAKVWDVTLK